MPTVPSSNPPVLGWRGLVLAAAFTCLGLAAGCAHYTVNRRLERPPEPGSGPRPLVSVGAATTATEGEGATAVAGQSSVARSHPQLDRSDDLLLVLAFSGGGKRAAALALGVLETLAQTQIDGPRGSYRLLDEVDVISAVSGGSFTAAYYGLFGEQALADFNAHFLKRSQRLDALLRLFNPWNWIRLASPFYGRSDLTAEYYDRILFHGKTYADLWAGGGPDVEIQATDITEGTRFTFSPEQFGLICSDLSTFPIARAVAASAAFPVLLSPVTLRNYAGSCAFPEPAWIAETLAKRDVTSREFYLAQHARAYRNARAKPYVHLVDGGVVDNLGLRGPLSDIILRGDPEKLLPPSTGAGDPETAAPRRLRVAFIIVNAQNRVRREFGLLAETPGTAQIADAVTSMMINRYNFETVDQLRQGLGAWSRDVRRHHDGRVDSYIIEVSFDALPDPKERDLLAALPTTMALHPGTIDHLRDAARRLLLDSAEFQRLITDLGGSSQTPTDALVVPYGIEALPDEYRSPSSRPVGRTIRAHGYRPSSRRGRSLPPDQEK